MEHLISLQEIQQHNKINDAWIVIDGKVLTVQFVVYPLFRKVPKF